ncbi:MAG: pyridoxal phosphate-dependent aminotransferase [bacterium]|nr:pyridoxal phosphate-dependent aminotransferase [bacterium]
MLSKRILKLNSSPILDLNAEVTRLQSAGVSVINLTMGEPDFGTPKHIGEAAKKAIDAGYTHYTPTAGILPLREAIAKKLLKDNSVSYAPSEISVGVGTKQILYNIFQVLCEKGDEVLIPVPTWATYVEQVKLADATPKTFPLQTPFKLTAAELEKHLSPKTKIIVLNTPSNPTGAVIEKDELRKIARLAVQRNIFVISDEIYEKILYGGQHCSIASLGEDIKKLTLTVNGFSKAYAMTGWRVGYVAGPKEVINQLNALAGQTTSGTSSISQWAALAATSGSEKSVQKMTAEFRKRRDFMFDAFSSMEGVSVLKPEGAFYLFPDVTRLLGRTYKTSAEWADALLKNGGVAVIPGEAFLATGHIRVSYAASMIDLKEAVKRIKNFLEHKK